MSRLLEGRVFEKLGLNEGFMTKEAEELRRGSFGKALVMLVWGSGVDAWHVCNKLGSVAHTYHPRVGRQRQVGPQDSLGTV